MANKVILVGNVGKDPEVKRFDSGSSVAEFSLATSKTFKDKAGEKQTNTQWHNVKIWGKLVDVVEKWVKKGSKLYIEGEITYEKYTDKEGKDRTSTKIVCNTLEMLGSKPEGQAQKPEQAALPSQEPTDLPF